MIISSDERIDVEFSGLNSRTHSLTWGQYGMWLMYKRIHPKSGILNLSTSVAISSKCTDADVHRSLTRLVEYHESLRTLIRLDAAGRPQAHVLPQGTLQVTHYGTGPDRSLEAIAADEAARVFDPSADLPIRVAVVDGGDTRSICFTYSHVAVDGYAIGTLSRQFLEHLSNAGARPKGAPTRFQPADLAAMEASPQGRNENRRSLRIWREVLLESVPAVRAAATEPFATASTIIGELRSRAALMAVAELARMRTLKTADAVLAAVAVALADASGEDRVFCQVVCHNRRSAEHLSLAGCLAQGGPFAMELGGRGLGEIVDAAERAAVRAYLGARYRSEMRDQVVAEVGAEQGAELDIRTIVSDEIGYDTALQSVSKRYEPEAVEASLADTETEVRTLDSASSERLFVRVYKHRRQLAVQVKADPAVYSTSQVSSLLEHIERALIGIYDLHRPALGRH